MGNTVISSTLLPIYAGLQIQPSGSDPAVGVFDSHTPPPYLPWSSFRINGSPDYLDMGQVMDDLGKRQITCVLVEGGAGLNASLLQQHLVDKLYWFIAPKMVGGNKAPGPVAGDGVETMDQALLLHDVQVKQMGADILIEAYTRW
jgi:riboflavin biosynthesis pyrimidine reductase